MFLLPLATLLRKCIEFRALLTSENSLKQCSAGQALGSLLCVYIHKWRVFLAERENPQSSATLHLKDDLLSGQFQILPGLENQLPPYSVLSPLHLLFSPLLPPSFLSDVCFKVRHRSGCLFPAFLQASLLLSITFICHSGSDGLSRLPHTSWRVTVCSQ